MAALRIRFSFRGGALKLDAVESTWHGASASDAVPGGGAGFWLSVHDRGGRQTHAQILTDPRTGGGPGPAGAVRDRDYVAYVPDPGPNGFVIFHLSFRRPAAQAGDEAPVAVFPLKTGAGFVRLLDKLTRAFAKAKRPAWLLLLSDGFAPGQEPLFDGFAQRFLDLLLAEPPFSEFPGLREAIAVRRGPPTAGGGFRWKITELAGRPLMEVDPPSVTAFVKGLDVDPINVLVVINQARYGGSGGDPAVTGLGAPGQLDSAVQAAIHELGHSAFALADEYEIAGAGASSAPIELNVAEDETAARGKWGELLTPGAALPSDPQAPGAETVVGMFQGAKWSALNYRSQRDCRMRSVQFGFCAACREIIRSTLECELRSVSPP